MHKELIQDWEEKRSKRKAAQIKLARRLGKSNKKSLNKRADELHDEVFEHVDCLKCANCCTSIPPIVDAGDINRAAKYLGMKPKEFATNYVTRDDDGDQVLNQSPCHFLEDDNSCNIYEARPKACRKYPHTDQLEFYNNLELHAANAQYCPAVFHILERLADTVTKAPR